MFQSPAGSRLDSRQSVSRRKKAWKGITRAKQGRKWKVGLTVMAAAIGLWSARTRGQSWLASFLEQGGELKRVAPENVPAVRRLLESAADQLATVAVQSVPGFTGVLSVWQFLSPG